MRALTLLALAAMLSDCSFLFDPSQVDSGLPQCPASTASCPARDNADVICDNDTCVYACKTGFSDRNLDLNAAASNGCEQNCSNDNGTVNPAGALANVGNSGEAVIAWPPSVPVADLYRVCTTLPSGEKCADVPALQACASGFCSTNLTGLPDNQRVTTTVKAGTFCKGLANMPAPPVVSYTSINGTTKFGFDIDGACGASISDTGNGVMSVSQSGGLLGCVTFFQIGDNQWGDGSIEFDVNIASSATSPYAVGVALHTDQTTSYAVGGATSLRDDGLCTLLPYRTGSGFTDVHFGAGSIFCGEPGKWTRIRLVANQGIFSLQAAGEGKPMKELTRWPSPVAGASGKKGRPALFIYSATSFSQQTALLRNLRVSTDSALAPNAGPSSANWNFAAGFPPEFKVQSTGTLDATTAACPTLPSATACSLPGGCAPAAGASCMHLQHSVNNGGFVAFDLPLGIDVSKPWSASMHVGTQGASTNNLSMIRSVHGAVLDVNGADTQPLRLMTVPLGAPLELNRWHRAAMTFFPDGGTDLNLDGAQTSVQRPANYDRHPGLFVLGAPGGNALYNAWVTDLSISQP